MGKRAALTFYFLIFKRNVLSNDENIPDNFFLVLTYSEQVVINEVLIDFRGETQIFFFPARWNNKLNSDFSQFDDKYIYLAKVHHEAVIVEVMLLANLNQVLFRKELVHYEI